MCSVESLRVDAVYVTHRSGDVGIRGLDEQMVVGGHQAVCSDGKVPDLCRFFEEFDKGPVIFFFLKDPLTSPAPVHDVIPGTWILDSQWSRHTLLLPELASRVKRRFDPSTLC